MYSFTEENYLKSIFKLSYPLLEGVSTNAIAEDLSTKAASVTDMLKKLAEKDLINYEKYKGVSLTKKGSKVAISIVRKHRLWEVFLYDKLKFGWDEVHEIAEQLEHIQSEKLIDRLNDFLGNPKQDPHGDLIPDKNGKFPELEKIKLSDARISSKYKISGVKDENVALLQHLEKLGIKLGLEITIAERFEFDGSLILNLKSVGKVQVSNEVANHVFVSIL